MLRQHAPAAFEPAQAAVAMAAARAVARGLRRRLRAQAADEQDFAQAILLDLIVRSARFQRGRGSWPAFVSNVTRNAAGRVAQKHIRNDRSTIALANADDRWADIPDARSTHIGLDLRRVLPRLPAHLRQLLDLVAESGSIAAARRAAGLSAPSFYRRVNELRLILLAEAASLGMTTQFEQASRTHGSRV
jgi:hypothetical protein